MSPAPKDWSEFIRDCKEGKTRNWLIKKYGFKDWGSLRRRVKHCLQVSQAKQHIFLFDILRRDKHPTL